MTASRTTTRTTALAVQRYATISDPLTLTALYAYYRHAFLEVSELAVQQHLMTQAEFEGIMLDQRVGKWFATDDDDNMVAMAVMTHRLEAWPLIAPAYFRRAYPGREIFYIGFVATQGGRHSAAAFQTLIAKMYQEVIAADGVAVMDFCGVNVDARRLPQRTDLLLKHINPAAFGSMIDRQEFWAWDFRAEPDPPAPEE